MPTAPPAPPAVESPEVKEEGESRARLSLAGLARRPFAREALVFAAFCLFTAVMTWPWVLHLRDAVADPGDPYMIAWTLWWDYHQTFNDPLHLFDANVFYPYRYTLAFSENDYGLALPFFPLFALGLRPLTVHAVATFLGFAFCGYGAFRLARTLTGSEGAAWVAGFVFAFIPFRFHLLAHLHYLFAAWIPLLLEALVLFARARTWRRAAWLGAAFLMNGLTCVSWLVLTLAPLALTGAYFVARSPALRRDRRFWLRAGVSLGVASLMLLPFLLPYYWVSVMYGLSWGPEEFARNSPTLMHWLSADGRVKLWARMGESIPGGHKLFPGLLAPLLALAALRVRPARAADAGRRRERAVVAALDLALVACAVVAALALGYHDVTFRVFGRQVLRIGERSLTHALVIGWFVLAFRLGFNFRGAFVGAVRGRLARAEGGDGFGREALAVGLIWAVWGFLASLGANFFLNRWMREYLLPYKSMRIPSRSAMVCYVGLALLAGVGAVYLARLAARARPRAYAAVLAALVLALAFELRAFPLRFEKGAADPDAVTLRLKETPMRGGLVELPSDGCCSRHRYMLRAADHGRPLVNATSSFVSPLAAEIDRLSNTSPIPGGLVGVIERAPASYLVIHNAAILPERRADYNGFLGAAVASGRLRFVNRFDGRDDLYAVLKNEPDARAEASPPAELDVRDWVTFVEEDPINLFGRHAAWGGALYRLRLVEHGRRPRYAEFASDLREVGLGLLPGAEDSDQDFERRLRGLAEVLARGEEFRALYEGLDDAQYVARLYENAGLAADAAERDALTSALASQAETRAGALLKVAADPRLEARERNRAFLLLHYFGYMRRDPDAQGFDFWLVQLDGGKDPYLITLAFRDSIEFKRLRGQ
jgi:hypothetical protein